MGGAGSTEEVHDVRVLVPIDRHTKLLKMFKELPVDDSFVFINDHDPLPLYYEFRSIHGDVVGWEYLSRGGTNWKVRVTRTEASKGREFSGISTLMDLRRIEEKDWRHVVFHRYGMMEKGHVMEIIAAERPQLIEDIFAKKYADSSEWQCKKNEPGEYVVHVTKRQDVPGEGDALRVVADFDIRPYEPAERHDRVFNAFDELKPGEAFIFTNDHDPKPLYYQIEAESREPFSWEYLESGPEAWKVKLGKTAA